MEELERLAGQVARSLNLSAETVADFAKSDEAIKGLADAFKANRTKLDTDGYQRAEGKIKAEVEKALKSAGVEAPSFDALADGLAALKGAAAAGDLTDEQALAHPAVKRALTEAANEKTRAVDAASKQQSDELKAQIASFHKEQQDAKVETAARAAIAELNPNLNPDSAKAQRQISRLVTDIKNGNYKLEGDQLVPVDGEGKYLDNGAGGSKSFTELVRDVVTAEYDLPAAQQRQAPPAGRPGADTGKFEFKHFTGAVPKTLEEITALRADQSIPLEARKELRAYGETLGT